MIILMSSTITDRTSSKLRGATNLLIVSLAVADLLLGRRLYMTTLVGTFSAVQFIILSYQSTGNQKI
jgi:hypothetical protein